MRIHLVVPTVALCLFMVACGDDSEVQSGTTTTADTSSSTTTTSTSAPATTSTTTSTTTTSAPTSTTTTSTSTTSAPPVLGQPAIWPAAGVEFDTPEAAAEDFVTEVLGVPAALGEFQAGDSRSGEIEVFSMGEGETATPVTRSVLLLRQLGPADSWFVLAAVNGVASITSPESMAQVVAGPLTVTGVGRGFEGLVVVEAFVAGVGGTPLDQVNTTGGSTEAAEPFSVEVDLSGAAPGDVVMLLVRGGVGLETDPGDFGAIPVTITP